MVGTMTVDYRGAKTVHMRTTGNDKSRFTCVLAILADGTNLPPMVIFKGKRLPKGDYPPDVVVRMNKDGWMTEELMIDWLDTIWGQRIIEHGKKRSLFVVDSLRGHLTQSVKSKCEEQNLTLAVIPGRLTSLVQPLDVSIISV